MAAAFFELLLALQTIFLSLRRARIYWLVSNLSPYLRMRRKASHEIISRGHSEVHQICLFWYRFVPGNCVLDIDFRILRIKIHQTKIVEAYISGLRLMSVWSTVCQIQVALLRSRAFLDLLQVSNLCALGVSSCRLRELL